MKPSLGRSVLSVLFVLALLPLHASARIGETPEQCNARYGEPLEKSDPGYRGYFKSGLMIVAQFFEGRCDRIGIYKEKKTKLGQYGDLSYHEIEILLSVNGGESRWETVESPPFAARQWRTKDGLVVAQYNTVSHSFTICTTAAIARQEAAEKAAEAEALSDF